MMTSNYSNPIRGMERRLAPDFAQREFRDPGLRGMSSGLGSLHHTMPHLRSIHPGVTRLQGGGAFNPVGVAYAASKPNLYNPDPMRRRILASLQFQPANPQFRAMPGSTEPLPYAAGGGTDDGGTDDGGTDGGAPDPEELMEPEDQQSPQDDEQREVVLEAMAALEGEAQDPEEALAHFIDVFGPRALKDLQQMVEAKHQQDDQGSQDQDQDQDAGDSEGEDDQAIQQMGGSPGEEDELQAAAGGLLDGPGTGQSDEIEGMTPSGRPVLLSDGEYVFDAPTVAALGDGSTNAGARRLDELRRQIRRDAYGHDKQAKPMAKGGRALLLRIP